MNETPLRQQTTNHSKNKRQNTHKYKINTHICIYIWSYMYTSRAEQTYEKETTHNRIVTMLINESK